MAVIDLARARAQRIRRTAAPSQGLGYAVLDVEPTGLRPGGHDRIVEIAIVRLDEQLEETDLWVTLVNPGRDIRRWSWSAAHLSQRRRSRPHRSVCGCS